MDVLILDDAGLGYVTIVQQWYLPELMGDRAATRSTIVASQYPVNNGMWQW